MDPNGVVLQVGMDVYGQDGQHVGTIKEVSDVDFELDRRLRRNLRVPRAAVVDADIDACRATLSVDGGAIEDQGWPHPPILGLLGAAEPPSRPERLEHLIRAVVQVVRVEDPLWQAIEEMEIHDLRSIVVVEDERPVGVLFLSEVLDLKGEAAMHEVRQRMHDGLPRLTSSMAISEARAVIATSAPAWIDSVVHLPVVDEHGALLGEVDRAAIERYSSEPVDETIPATSSPPSTTYTPPTGLL